MTELKRICPFCGGKMIGSIGHPLCHYNTDCIIHDESIPQELLDLLEDTKKKLEYAGMILKNLLPYLNGYEKLDVQKAIKRINQKD